MALVRVTEEVVYEINIPDSVPADEWESYWADQENVDQFVVAVEDRSLEEA